MSVEWRMICGFPAYEVSSEGEVRRAIYAARNTRVGHVLKTFRSASGKGYATVVLCNSGTKQKHSVHRLVCQAFNGPAPSPTHHAAHENGDRQDNRAANLTWKSPSANAADKVRHGTHNRGERHSRHVLSDDEATYVRNAVGTRGLGLALANHFGVSQSLVSMIRNGKHRTARGAEQ